jgi:hypothetical protein
MKSFRLLNARARRARPRDAARNPGRAGRPILRLATLATLAGGAFLAVPAPGSAVGRREGR